MERGYSVAVVNVGPGVWRVLLIIVIGLLLLSGCATYQPQPLQDEPILAADIKSLQVEGAASLNELLGGHEINAADGVDLYEVATLAVLNNPELKAKRAQVGVARAQVFATGLLPDPQFNAGFDRPTGDTSGLVTAWALELSYEIIPLITRSARVDAQTGAQSKVRLDLLWQEWKVIQQARSLAVDQSLEQQRLALLNKMLSLYRERYDHSTVALATGDITLGVNGTDLTALLDTLSQINQLEQTLNQTRHDLNLLLGLQPDVNVAISALPAYEPLSAESLRSSLGSLSRRRPDLMALQAGYASQEAQVRAAILAQFPSLGISVNQARDTSDVETLGLGVTLSLPLLSGNRGNIAIERATRDQLREEYQARLAQTATDIDRLRNLQDIIQRQNSRLDVYLPQLKVLVDRASKAYTRGDIDVLTFLNMESTWVNKRLEQLNLLQSGWENRIALEALLAMPSYPRTGILKKAEGKDVAP
jgi:cobalt-zinc-cadmium efflux system outer membrane protein